MDPNTAARKKNTKNSCFKRILLPRQEVQRVLRAIVRVKEKVL